MMKPGYFLLLALVWQLTKAQQPAGLGQDPVFTYVLARRIVYPPEAIYARVYTNSRIYTRFRIDSSGHIQDITTLNPSGTGYGFEQQITQALKHLPPLKPAYAGNYIIPVLFVYVYGNGREYASVDTSRQTSLTNNELRAAYPGQTVLPEMRIKAYKPR